MEHKDCSFLELKFAEVEAGEAMMFEGYGAVFNNVDDHGDMIAPGAFADTLAEAQQTGIWPKMLSQHGGGLFGTAQDMMPVGAYHEISEDGKGLFLKGELAPTPRGQEIYTLMKMKPRPAIDGLSIGYRVIEYKRREKPEDPRRTLTKLKLFEVSPVTFPANGKARVTGVKAIDDLGTPAEIETYLREAGMSRNEAKHLIAKIKGVDLREAEALNELASSLQRNIEILRGNHV